MLSPMTRAGKAAAVAIVALVILAIGWAYLARSRAAASSATAMVLGHFDHRPRHGGLVLMNGDTHFEVVREPDGGWRIYFSDAVRNPLPAATASHASVTVPVAGGTTGAFPFTIDSSGSYWVGRAPLVVDPTAVVRIGYTAGGDPYWIDMPIAAWAATAPAR